MGIDGRKIKSAREAVGLDQHDLAFKMGVEPPTVSRWETGVNSPRPAQIPKLAEILGRDAEWFLEDDSSDYMNRLKMIEQQLAKLQNESKAAPSFKLTDDEQRLIQMIRDLNQPTLLPDFIKTVERDPRALRRFVILHDNQNSPPAIYEKSSTDKQQTKHSSIHRDRPQKKKQKA